MDHLNVSRLRKSFDCLNHDFPKILIERLTKLKMNIRTKSPLKRVNRMMQNGISRGSIEHVLTFLKKSEATSSNNA